MASESPSREQIVRTFGGDAADFIEHAAALGWRVLFNSTGTSITLIPYDDGPKRIHLSARNKNRGALRKHIKTLIRHGDPKALKMAESLVASDFPEDAKSQFLKVMGAETLNETGVQVQEPEEKPTPKRARKPEKAAPEKPTEAEVPVPTPAVMATSKKRIINETPALMHYTLGQNGGKSYPSQTTLERHYSDGSTEYVCVCCQAVSENRRAFGGAHWAMHVRKNEAKPVDDDQNRKNLIDDPSYTEPAWTRKADLRAKRIAELTSLLNDLDFDGLTNEEIAEKVMDFLGDNGMGGGGGGSAAPLTAEETLDRIRTMIDRGTYAAQEQAIYEREKQLDDLTQYAEAREQELQEKLLVAEQRAVKAESTMSAFIELVQEIKQ